MVDHIERSRSVGAIVGAALGDALGWPHEMRATAAESLGGKLGLTPWQKKSGGRFAPYVEHIGVGSYSDDTQLILALSRCRLAGGDWWNRFARVELPFWLHYERGGGGATLRAARLHLKGVVPWKSAASDRQKYFEAGGNGVAMRVLPHVIVGKSFDDVASSVMADGVITHGHPRALVGALAYAFGLFSAFRIRGTLSYGALIQIVLDGVDHWSRIPNIESFWPTWARAANGVDGYDLIWDGAVYEVYEALKLALKGLETGALSNDEEVLERLGCFNRKVNGAGTVAAVASLFLVSKHAAAPMQAVARAALAEGADTDTIASMCGGLAGALAGVDWMGLHAGQLQDLMYLDEIGMRLVVEQPTASLEKVRPFMTKDADRFVALLRQGETNVRLPIDLTARTAVSPDLYPASPNVSVESWSLKVNGGPTFVVKKIGKLSSPTKKDRSTGTTQNLFPDLQSAVFSDVSRIVILVRDLSASRTFYENALNLPVHYEASGWLRLGSSLWLRQADDGQGVGGVALYIDVADVAECHRRVASMQPLRLSKVTQKAGKAAFACTDPDGHRLEIFEMPKGPPA